LHQLTSMTLASFLLTPAKKNPEIKTNDTRVTSRYAMFKLTWFSSYIKRDRRRSEVKKYFESFLTEFLNSKTRLFSEFVSQTLFQLFRNFLRFERNVIKSRNFDVFSGLYWVVFAFDRRILLRTSVP
jgi:hypothetical protein